MIVKIGLMSKIFKKGELFDNMSCDYADGLSPYNHKGLLGLPEKFDSPKKVLEKCLLLTQMIKEAKHIVVHTGAGISTSAGIPDFRGPKGVWTLEEKGLKPEVSISFAEAKPTKTHMALKRLVDEDMVKYIISQNIDGLHLKSGLKRTHLAELHGNMFVEQCNICKKQFVRTSPTTTVGQKYLGKQCYGERMSGRKCRGKIHDVILDWEHSLPDDDLDMADMQSSIADLSICLGTTLQIVPSGVLPLNTLRYGGKLVICNLQSTKHDNKADLIINSYVDDIIEHIMNNLEQKIPNYCASEDPTLNSSDITDWTICRKQVMSVKKIFKNQCEGVAKKRSLVKNSTIVKKPKIEDKIIKKIKLTKVEKSKKDSTCESSDSKSLIDIKKESVSKDVINEESIKVEKCVFENTKEEKDVNVPLYNDVKEELKHEEPEENDKV